MISGRGFIVFSDDWGRHPSSSQHLFRRIAPENRVLWVNTIGTRTPGLSRADLARAAGKLREWTAGGSEPEGGEEAPVRILRPFMTPFDRWTPLRKLNARLLREAVRKGLALHGIEDPLFVTTIPNVAALAGELGECASVYYCVDEFSEWPGADRKSMIAMEEELLARVDLVVATSEALFESKSARHPRVRLMRHGVDWQRFRAAEGEAPAALTSLPRPRFGFTGLVDERLDVSLLEQLASALPDASFVFVGPRQLPRGPLDRIENVHFLDPVAYEGVPAVLRELDVALLPYRETALTERINPLKLREFLASGLPIVATPLPETRRFRGLVRTPKGLDEWLQGLRESRSEGRSRSEERAASVRNEGWDMRAEEFSRHCLEAEETARVTR